MSQCDDAPPKLVSLQLVWAPAVPDSIFVTVQSRSASLDLTRRDLVWLITTMKRVHAADRASAEATQQALIGPFTDLHRALKDSANEQARRQWLWLKDWAELMRQMEAADGTALQAPSDEDTDA